jgi:flagellar hook-basal body complex protein FliE
MSSDDIQQSDQENLNRSLAEVQFALVLSRMINSVNEDQDQLREAIYDLARYKLQEQLSGDFEESQRARAMLETAIKGVESFSRQRELPRPQPPQLAGEVWHPARPRPLPPADALSAAERPRHEMRPRRRLPMESEPEPVVAVHSYPRTKGRWGAVGRVAGLILLLVASLAAIRYQETLSWFHDGWMADRPSVSAQAVASIQPAAKQAAPTPSPLIPTNFGVYGITDNKLFELNQLPGRAQDMRVALSPTIALPHETVLPNGRIKFIVYRREAATSIPDRVDVRIIARVMRETTYDVKGNPVTAPADGWYIRNIVFSYRVSPVKDNAEMFEIQPEDPVQDLSPGRYALVLKGQMYDFIVGGTVTDPRHCLERLTAANGVFVSECKTS